MYLPLHLDWTPRGRLRIHVVWPDWFDRDRRWWPVWKHPDLEWYCHMRQLASVRRGPMQMVAKHWEHPFHSLNRNRKENSNRTVSTYPSAHIHLFFFFVFFFCSILFYRQSAKIIPKCEWLKLKLKINNKKINVYDTSNSFTCYCGSLSSRNQ